MPASDLNGLIDAIEEGNVSASQLERLSTALRSTLNRRIHSTNLVKLNRGHWLNVDRMETESDGFGT